MRPTEHQRGARVPLHLTWKHPGLPRDWVRVLEGNEEAMNPRPLHGYVWLDASPWPLHVWAPHLEFQD